MKKLIAAYYSIAALSALSFFVVGCSSLSGSQIGAAVDAIQSVFESGTTNNLPEPAPGQVSTNNASPTPTTSTPEPATGDILSSASWGPKKEGNPAKAKIVCSMSGAKISGGKVSFKDDRPSWPRTTKPGALVEAVIYIAVERGSSWQVSKFDWLRPGQRSKTLHNIITGYPGFTPASGSRVCFVIASINGKERSSASNIVTWP